jgi:hypothetical protein
LENKRNQFSLRSPGRVPYRTEPIPRAPKGRRTRTPRATRNENFLQQVNLAEQLTSSDFGVATGLISQGYWEQSKWYFVNVERGNIADKLQPRNINVSFNNNSNVNIDVIIFTFYNDQLTIDVETGQVTK